MLEAGLQVPSLLQSTTATCCRMDVTGCRKSLLQVSLLQDVTTAGVTAGGVTILTAVHSRSVLQPRHRAGLCETCRRGRHCGCCGGCSLTDCSAGTTPAPQYRVRGNWELRSGLGGRAGHTDTHRPGVVMSANSCTAVSMYSPQQCTVNYIVLPTHQWQRCVKAAAGTRYGGWWSGCHCCHGGHAPANNAAPHLPVAVAIIIDTTHNIPLLILLSFVIFKLLSKYCLSAK